VHRVDRSFADFAVALGRKLFVHCFGDRGYADMILIDEKECRNFARLTGLNVRGVVGILLRANAMSGIVSIEPEIAALRSHAGDKPQGLGTESPGNEDETVASMPILIISCLQLPVAQSTGGPGYEQTENTTARCESLRTGPSLSATSMLSTARR
jgi:hypothetical protein